MRRYRWLIALIVLVEAIVIAPTVIAPRLAPPGTIPAHVIFVPTDSFVYENYIEQVQEGRWTFQDRMTSEPQRIGIFNIFWLAVGLLGKLFHLAGWQAVLLARIVTAPLVILALYFAAGFFLHENRQRMLATWFLAFISGIGFLYSDFVWPDPVDFLAPEATPMNSILSSPHIMASFALLTVTYLMFFRWTEKRELRDLSLSALAGAVLLQFHPYYAPALLLTTGIWCVYRRAPLRWYGLYLGVLGLPVFYHLLTLLDPFTQARYATNQTPSAPIWMNLVSFLPLVILAFIGCHSCENGNHDDRIQKFALVWLGVGVVLMYAPLQFNQRFVETLIVPLGMLAFLGLLEVWHQLQRFRSPELSRLLFAVFVMFLTVGSVIDVMVLTKFESTLFQNADLAAAIERLGQEPAGVVFAAPDTSLYVAGRTHHHTYVAHWSETLDYVPKAKIAMALLDIPVAPEFRDRIFLDTNNPPPTSIVATLPIDYLLLENRPCFPGFTPFDSRGEFVLCARQWKNR